MLAFSNDYYGIIFRATQSVELFCAYDMSSMFDGCSSLTDLNALINWDTSAVNNMKAMFNGISQLTDTSALNDWDILNTSNFTNMFLNCPSHPEFTKRPGTWDGNGTFIPSA